DAPPIVYVPKEGERGRWLELLAQRTSVRQRLDSARTAPSAAFDAWLVSRDREEFPSSLANAEIFYFLADGVARVWVAGAATNVGLVPGVSLDQNDQSPGQAALKFTEG